MTERVATELFAGLSLFSDLTAPQLEAAAHTFDEETFGAGERILRQGFTGTGFYVLVEGEASVHIDGQERARLSRGEYFGEISALLEEPPSADVIAETDCRCLSLSAHDLSHFLRSFPEVSFRLLQAEARRLKARDQWRA